MFCHGLAMADDDDVLGDMFLKSVIWTFKELSQQNVEKKKDLYLSRKHRN